MAVLFSTAYLPPLSHFSALLKAEEVIIEQYEHYIKQTYRNRLEMYGANGMLPLTIPVEHTHLSSIPIKEVRISYDQPWQKIHWRSITSAYRNSPYFEYYEDELIVFFEKEYKYLFEWNYDLLAAMLRILGIKKNISFTKSYQPPFPPKGGESPVLMVPIIHDERSGMAISDLRNEFKPGRKTPYFTSSKDVAKALPSGGMGGLYHQVFSDRHGFIPDLSIIDLVFNEGPKAQEWLKIIAP